mgnify:CR=1 FL=1
MADIRKNKNSYRTVYINDNLARRQEYVETTSPKRQEVVIEQPEHRTSHEAHQSTARGLRSSFGVAFTLVMAAAMAAIFIVLARYISLNVAMTQKSKQVSNLRKELSTITMENDNMEMAINSSIDYDYIYKVATEELGMVYASQNQIVTYDSEDSEYVVQYKDVE